MIEPDELSAEIYCFKCFKTGPPLPQVLRRMLRRCFAVKLQKCFVGYETSPDFPPAWNGVDKDRIFLFLVNLSVNYIIFPSSCSSRLSSSSSSISMKLHSIQPDLLFAIKVKWLGIIIVDDDVLLKY